MMTEREVKLQKARMLVCLIKKYAEPVGAGHCVHIITDDATFGATDASYRPVLAAEVNENLIGKTGSYEPE